MPKRAMSFKPTPECEVQLAELMDRWKCDRTAAIVKAISLSFWPVPHKTLMVEPTVAKKQPPMIAENLPPNRVSGTQPAEVVARMTVPGDKSEGRKASPPPKTRPLTREEREARTAEFQRKMVKK